MEGDESKVSFRVEMGSDDGLIVGSESRMVVVVVGDEGDVLIFLAG